MVISVSAQTRDVGNIAPYHRAAGAAVTPCNKALIQTALIATNKISSPSAGGKSSTTSSAKSAVARPRGPNQPKNKRVSGAASVPRSDIQMASGRTIKRLIRIIARLSSVIFKMTW